MKEGRNEGREEGREGESRKGGRKEGGDSELRRIGRKEGKGRETHGTQIQKFTSMSAMVVANVDVGGSCCRSGHRRSGRWRLRDEIT